MKKLIILTLTACLILPSLLIIGNAAALSTQRIPVIIRFKDKPNAGLIRTYGGNIKYTYNIIPAIACSLSPTWINILRNDPRIAYIQQDSIVRVVQDQLPWGVDRIDAELVHPYNNGTGVKVAIIDTGIDYNHPDLDDNYKGGYDFVNDDADPLDDNGHGTHCAGIVAAEGNGEGVIGVAPEAYLYAVKVLDSGGSGYVSDVVAGIEWAVDNGMQIISMSLGSNSDSQVLHDACDDAYTAGVLLVAAAGNDYRGWGRWFEFDTVDYPGRYSSVIAVGATDNTDTKASWSSTGSALELAAPGVSIKSTYLGNTYATMSGTSMACPHVAGTAALVWAGEPTLTNKDVRTRLQETADDLGSSGKDKWYGWGLVDANEAAPPTGPSPNQPPVADAGFDQTLNDADGSGSETVTLDGFDSYDPDGSIVSYEWAEGPTILGTTAVITADFTVGTHTITLTVTDDDGATDSDDVIITVKPNQPPVADAGPDQTVLVEDTLTFDGSGSSDSDGTIVSYEWNFGDGSSASGVTVTHSYSGNGTYTVTLTVEDNGGATDTDTAIVEVYEEQPPPPPDVMHVESIDMSKETWWFLKRAVVVVTIFDADGNPVEGATVSGTWSGLTTESESGVTGSDGKVTFYTNWIWRGDGTCTFTVDDVTKTGWTYDPGANKETSDNITI